MEGRSEERPEAERTPSRRPKKDLGGKINERVLQALAVILTVVAVILLVLMLYFALRPRPVEVVKQVVTSTPTRTSVPLLIPPPLPTTAPTVTSTPTSIFETPVPPGTADPSAATGQPLPTVPASGIENSCRKGGVAWHDENREGGGLYGEATLGDAKERCWLVGQIWTDQGEVAEAWVFAIAPGSVATFSNYRGGIAWFFAGDQAAVQADLEKQEGELKAKDQSTKITKVMLPNEANQCRLVVRAGFP